MPIEYEMMLLKRITDAAITRHNSWTGSDDWDDNGSMTVKDMIMCDATEDLLLSFSQDEINAMRDLIRRGYWLKWNDETKNSMLYRISHI
jgi:hypothetical protein